MFGERRDPFRAITRMRRDMDRMFDSFLGESWPQISEAAFQPACDIEDRETHYLLNFDLPGMSRKDVKIEVVGNQLHVSGERKHEHEAREGRHFESERYYGYFERWLTLPEAVRSEQVEARMENGVLQIAIPKTEATKSREIAINEGKTGIFSKLLEKKGRAA